LPYGGYRDRYVTDEDIQHRVKRPVTVHNEWKEREIKIEEERFKLPETKEDETAANEDLDKGTGIFLAEKSKTARVTNSSRSFMKRKTFMFLSEVLPLLYLHHHIYP
jgi:hypothetical protein